MLNAMQRSCNGFFHDKMIFFDDHLSQLSRISIIRPLLVVVYIIDKDLSFGDRLNMLCWLAFPSYQNLFIYLQAKDARVELVPRHACLLNPKNAGQEVFAQAIILLLP